MGGQADLRLMVPALCVVCGGFRVINLFCFWECRMSLEIDILVVALRTGTIRFHENVLTGNTCQRTGR